MRITSVAIDGVGRFGTPTRIDNLRAGVNILAADNEAGKSTFFRSIRTCIFERHGSKNADVIALATEGLSLPVTITLCFEHGQKSYEITKSFVKSPSASLRCEGIEVARNREADEKLWEILGISQNGSRSVDEAAFGILWVSQGKSFNVPEPTEGAASALNAAIQAEVGTLVGGERARQVLAKLISEISKQETDNGKPRTSGALADAIRHTEAVNSELLDASSQLANLDKSLDELAVLGDNLRRLASPQESVRLATELEEASQKLVAGENAASTLERYKREEQQSLALLTSRKELLESLELTSGRIDENQLRCEKLTNEMSPLDADEIISLSFLAKANTTIQNIDDRARVLDSQEHLLQRIVSLNQKESSQNQLKSQIEKLKDYEFRLTGAEAALKANLFDSSAIGILDKIERDLSNLHAGRKAGAAKLTVDRKGTSSVTINGLVHQGNALLAVTEPIEIQIDNSVTITISPPLASVTEPQKKIIELDNKLYAMLLQYGVATVEAFHLSHQVFCRLEDALRELKAEGKALGLTGQPSVEIARMTVELIGNSNQLDKLLGELAITLLPSAEDTEVAQAAIVLERDQIRKDRIHLEGAASGHNTTLVSLGAKRGTLQGQRSELSKQLQNDLSVLPDEQRQAKIETCQLAVTTLSEEYRIKVELLAAQTRNALPHGEIERFRNRVSRLIEAKMNREKTITDTNQRIAHLEGQILVSGGEGLGEKSAILKQQLVLGNDEVARQKLRVQTFKLLQDVVKKSYDKRREELHAPLRRHLKPFLNDVFPLAEIKMGDGFAVSGLTRNGIGAESFSRLSDGTKEQIAVLVRLAMGAMICEKNHEVPIILDDALVFSDDTRIEQMFDALNRAGKNQQIIIMTCRTRTFSSLGGNIVEIQGTKNQKIKSTK